MLSDLVFVLKHIKKILEEYQLVDLYQNFAATLQQIASSSTPEYQKQLKDYRERITQAHEQLEPVGWSYSQLQIFKGFGAEGVLGESGYKRFLNALSENSANTPGAVEEINRQRQQIEQLLTNANNVLASLGGLAKEREIEAGQTIVQIVFEEEVAIETFSDLFTQSKEWKDIIRAFSLLAKVSPNNTRIIASSKGSPYTVWLATAQFVGETLCATIKPFVELYREVLKAREHALMLEDMKVGVDGKKFELFKAIDDHERKRIMEIVDSVAEINGNNKLSEAEKNEAKTALGKIGPDLYQFITKGGKVDVSKPDGDNKVFSNFQLATDYREVGKLKDNVLKLIEARKEQENQSVEEEEIETKVKNTKDDKTQQEDGTKS